MRHPQVFLLGLAAYVISLAPAQAGAAATSAAELRSLVDAYCDSHDLAATVEALEAQGITPEELRELLVAGRELTAMPAGRSTISITDEYGGSSEAVLVVPEGYDPKRPVGVIIGLHGLGADGANIAGLFEPLARAQGAILVCPTAKPLPSDKPHPDTAILATFPQLSGTHWWSYWSGSFPLELLRELGRTYAIDRDRVILSGYSMGGFGTWNIGMRFPDRFAAIAPLAGGISGREYMGGFDTVMRPLLENLVGMPVWFAHGDADTTVPSRFDEQSDAELKAFGSRTHTFVKVPGGTHQLDVMPGSKLGEELEDFLGGKQRATAPKAIRHVAHHADHGACHWIAIKELSGETGKVEAELTGKGKIEIRTEGVARLVVRLSSEQAKLDKPVQIKVNGKQAFKGKVEASLATLLETWRESEDPALLYDASVEIEIPAKSK